MTYQVSRSGPQTWNRPNIQYARGNHSVRQVNIHGVPGTEGIGTVALGCAVWRDISRACEGRPFFMRTHHRLSLERIEEAAQIIDPVFLRSPQFVSESLGEMLGVQLLLKVETMNPIRSFKGRGTDFLVSQVQPGTALLCASAGNLGQAMAYTCRKRGVKVTVYASTSVNTFKLERMRSLGAQVILHGDDFDAAKLEAKRVASTTGTRFIEDSLDIETLEGAGTIGLELLDAPVGLDALLVAVGNGALFNGVARVMKARSPKTKMIAVQAAGASAMIDSLRAGRLIVHDQIQTIADGIAGRIPILQA